MGNPEEPKAAAIRGARPFVVLGALILGLLAGIGARGIADPPQQGVIQAAAVIGELWLNLLKMTVVPLVVALLVVGIARSAQAARAGRIAGRSVLWIVIICTLSAALGMATIQLLVAAFPLPASAAEALRAAVGVDAAAAKVPGAADFLRAVVPSNVFASASSGEVLPLVVFTLFFAVAVARVAGPRREILVGFFEAAADALLLVIGWVLWAAPLGVFALALAVGFEAGSAAFAGLAHYVLLLSAVGAFVTLLAYPVAAIFGGVPLGRFAGAMLPPQSVAISTRSSLASLPAMLAAARGLRVRDEVVDVTLPIAVALFRATGPAMNVAVVFYVAHWIGLEPSVGQMIAAVAVGAVMSYAAVSLPGEVSFISSIAPIAIALGVPIAPLGLLIAVEMVPDIFRTLGNVSMDVAVTTAVDRSTAEGEDQRPAISRTRSE